MTIKAKWVIAAMAAAILCWTGWSGFLIFPDTADYVGHAVVRPLGYPLTLDLFRTLFGARYFTAVMLFQTLMVLLASFYGSSVLRRRFGLPDWALVLLYFMLITPLLPSKSLYASSYGNIGRGILSEALAYSVFITAFGLMVDGVFEPRRKNFVLFAALSVLLTLLRSQMVFMIPVAAGMIYLAYRELRSARFAAALAVGLALSLAAAGMAQRAYLAAVRGGSVAPQRASNIFLLPVIYLSDRPDLDAVRDPADKKILAEIFDRFDAEKIFAKYHLETGDNVSSYYVKQTPPVYRTINSVLRHEYGHDADDYDVVAVLNGFSGRVLPVLLKRHFRDYFRFSAGMFLYLLNFREGFFFAVLLIAVLRREEPRLRLALFLAASIALSNRALLALTVGNDRHLFATNTIEQVMFAAALIYWARRESLGPGVERLEAGPSAADNSR